jgi:hypothetical protein
MANPQCPRCKSYKTLSLRILCIATGLSAAGCLGPIFLLVFFPLMPVTFIGGLIVAGVGLAQGKKFVCQDCKEKFEVRK